MIGSARDIEAGAVLDADICIVGSGAAGISLALALLDSGLSVLMLEGGGERLEESAQALYDGAVADPALHAPPIKYRRRGFGGATAIWGGRCVPFDPIDFEQRPWIAGSFWPFGLETLLPWYAQANELCEAGRFAYTVQAAFAEGARPMLAGFQGKEISDTTLERFSIPTDFGARYRARLAQCRTLRVLLHANVTQLRPGEDGRTVESADVACLHGHRFTVRARRFVLAVGGLETPRLLLASRTRHDAGIGNDGDQVGRNYMCHLAGTLGRLALAGSREDIWHGYDVSDDGIYCRRRLALTAAAQRRRRTGNFIARLHHPRIPDPAHGTGALSALYLAKPFISYEYSRRLHGDGRVSAWDWLRHARNVARDPAGTGGFLLHWLARRTLAARKYPSVIVACRTRQYSLDFNAEQEPNPASRITLTQDKDALGVQKIMVDWRHTAMDMHTIREGFAVLASELAASGTGVLSYDPAEVDMAALRDGAYGGHHIGTARMSATPRTGVVDADCRVHGMRNLFVAGSAVFPTSSQANPTLTIVAMALRLGDYLRRKRGLLF